jgi:hypothetical protein
LQLGKENLERGLEGEGGGVSEDGKECSLGDEVSVEESERLLEESEGSSIKGPSGQRIAKMARSWEQRLDAQGQMELIRNLRFKNRIR